MLELIKYTNNFIHELEPHIFLAQNPLITVTYLSTTPAEGFLL